MAVLFETLRGVFLSFTVLLILFLTMGAQIFDPITFSSINATLMPAYLLLVGIIIGYILNLLSSTPEDTPEQIQRNNSTSYIQGLIVGIFLALLYIFLG